jgi:DNA polymerase type B, organellar and viral
VRTAHWLRGNLRNETVHNYVVVDTETDQVPTAPGVVTHRLRFGVAAAKHRTGRGTWPAPVWCPFRDAGDWWDFLEAHTRPKERCYVFCHNTNFDIPVLDAFGALRARGWVLERAIIDGPPTILTWRRDRAVIQWLDTLNIWRMSLAQLGVSVGLAKLDMPAPDAPADVWDRYARRDVEVLMVALEQWWEYLKREDLGGFAPTLASQALRTYRHKYMDHKILIDADPEALRLGRAAYSGGRTECWRLGEVPGRWHLFDVNSMYPAVMHEHDYPAQLRSVRQRVPLDLLRRWCTTGAVVAEVELTTDEPVYALRAGGRLIFPVGAGRAVLCTPELRYALAHGHIIKVLSAAYYQTAPLFRRFVANFYARRVALRDAGNEAEAWRYKILLNSLYGKFGQRGLVWEGLGATDDTTARRWTVIHAQTGAVTRYRQLGGLYQIQETEAESRDSHPAIAAHVTAYARMLLWTYCQRAGRAHVAYMDTDSVLVDDDGAARLAGAVHPTRLGALKREGTYTRVVLYGPKDYVMGDKIRTKGVRSRATWTGPNQVQQERWSSLRGLLAAGRMTEPTTATVTKILKREYLKGTVRPDGTVGPPGWPTP